MARRIGSVCRLCRREGIKLFIKGERCVSNKCSFDKRGYKPGQHSHGRSKLSDYGIQLREKQKVKRVYGILEKQFRTYFKKAEKQKGITGEILLQFLERRLDNVVFLACFASSRPEARQMVRHGLVTVDGEKLNIPSYILRKDAVIQIKVKEARIKRIKESIEANKDRGIPEWIRLDVAGLTATVTRLPERKDITFPIQEQLIVELYSK